MIRFLDLRQQYDSLAPEIDAAIRKVLADCSFIGGPDVANFEREFMEYQDAAHCVGVGNGTDALEIALEALQLPPGAEVVVPANTFIASSEAVTRAGFRVTFADTDPDTYLLTPDSVREVLTPRTVAVVAVHLYGQPAPMRGLRDLCREHGLKLIEDAAQAHGSEFEGRRVGAIGDVGTFSFYPGKNLGAYGDAGAIVTNDAELAGRCRMIANHGRSEKYVHEFEGRNSRLDGLQAAVLRVKLRHLDEWIDRRRQVAATYNNGLAGLDVIALPAVAQEVKHVYHLYVIRCAQRRELQDVLAEQGIETGRHYPISLPQQPAYSHLDLQGRRPVAIDQADQLLSLPIGEHMSTADAEVVVEAVRAFCAS